MGSLSKCLSKNQIMGEDDIAEVSRLYEANLASGMSPRDAELAAARAVLADLESVRAGIWKQIEAAPVSSSPIWLDVEEVETPEGPTSINRYYVENPDMMLGKMRLIGSMYGKGEPVLIGPTDNLDEKIIEAVKAGLPENVITERGTTAQELRPVDTQTDGIKDGAYYLKGKALYRKVAGVGEPINVPRAQREKIEMFLGMRDVVNEMLAIQGGLKEARPERMGQLRKGLNEGYDAFVKAHGPIKKTVVTKQNRKDGKEITIKRFPNISAFEDDPDAYKVAEVEVYDEKTDTAKKAAIFTQDIVSAYIPPDVQSPADALAVSLNEKGGVDISLIANRLGLTEAEAIAALGEQVFLDPVGETYRTASEYLAGDVVGKLETARTAAETNPAYERNVAALAEVQPEPLTRADIRVPFGAPYIPVEVYEQYLTDVLKARRIKLRYDDVMARWYLVEGSFPPESEVQFGTKRRSVGALVEAALNSATISITYKDDEGKTIREPEAEAEARAKVDIIKDTFSGDPEQGIEGWLWGDYTRATRIEAAYNNQFNRIVQEKHDGSHLTFPGLARVVTAADGSTFTIDLKPHRVNAIWKVIKQGNALFNHAVGSGKAQPLDAKVLTPDGWKRMGDIRVGDQVIAGDGSATTVLGVYPQGVKPIYRIRFSDGAVTECCDEHLWVTQTRRERGRMRDARSDGRPNTVGGMPKVRPLSEIRTTLDDMHFVPTTGAVQHPKVELPLDPYTLGALIGDASFRQFSVQFGTKDAEILDQFLFPDGAQIKGRVIEGRCPIYWITYGGRRPNPLNQILRDMGLWWLDSRAKFIPERYKFAHADDRLGLLQGLMDTDGGITGRSCRFTSYSKTLADDVAALARSLGGVASVALREAADGSLSKYVANITLPAGVVPFRLSRKVAAYRALHDAKKTIREPLRAIVAVDLIGHKEAQCIAIEHPTKLYVTDDYVVTHNTWTSIMASMEMKRLGMIQRPLFCVPNHMLNQFATEFYQAYPNAKLLIATKDQMNAKNRKRFAARIAADTWDGIIITHSSFGKLGLSKQAYQDYYREQMEELEAAMKQAQDADDESAVSDMMRKWKKFNEETGGDSDAEPEGITVKNKRRPTNKQKEAKKDKAKEKLKKLVAEEDKDDGVVFEETGIDFMFVDEAHLFKSLPFQTMHTRIKGIGGGSSKRAVDLFLKMRHLEKSRPGRSAVFMTGTPVSNTMAELYTMQRYLQGPTLKKFGIDKFDAWAGTFGKIVTKSELASNSRDYKDTESFSEFVNMPELMTIAGSVMDTQTAEMLKLPRPELKGGKLDVVQAQLSPDEEGAINDLIAKMEKREKDDPFLPLFTAGIQLATDMRLVDPSAPFNPNGKIAQAVNNIFKIWEEGNADPAAPNKGQLVFLDMGVPGSKGKAKAAIGASNETEAGPQDDAESAIDQIRKELAEEAGQVEEGEEVDVDEDQVEAEALLRGKFNLYQDIKDRLIAKGVPKDQIAFIHDAKNDDQKAKMFEKMRSGDIRVMIGSTGKMGVGTNVQKLLYAMHHLDAPWRPADLEQRDGRILRQGNKNKEVRIFRYITVKSFDAYRWQLLDRKSQFIGQLYAGAAGVRHMEDITPPLPEAAELKAAATGNPLIIERAELEREVRKLEVAERAHYTSQKAAAKSAKALQDKVASLKAFNVQYEQDVPRVEDMRGDAFKVKLETTGKPTVVDDRKKAGEFVKRYLLGAGQQWYKTTVDLGEISSFAMRAEVKKTIGGVEVMPIIEGTATYQADQAFVLGEDADPGQVIQRWVRVLTGVPAYAAKVSADIARDEDTLPKMQEAATPKPFPQTDKLVDKRKRLETVVTELNRKPVNAADLMPKPGKPVLSEGLDPKDWRDLKLAIKKSQGDADFEALYPRAVEAHAQLTAFAKEIADQFGVPIADPGPKGRARAEEKLQGREAWNLTDLARAGFTVPSRAVSDAMVDALAQRFAIVDEGWAVTPSGYFDRKLMVILDNGVVAELQMWPPGMYDAKENRGGHKLYEQERAEGVDDDTKARLQALQRELYATVVADMPMDFQELAVSKASAAERSAAGYSAESSSRETSGASLQAARSMGSGLASNQSPDLTTAALSASTTAGEPSQSKYLMAGSPSTENIGETGENRKASGQDVALEDAMMSLATTRAVNDWFEFTQNLKMVAIPPRIILGEYRVETRAGHGTLTYTVHRGRARTSREVVPTMSAADETQIGRFYLRTDAAPDGFAVSVQNMSVDPEYQGRGIATTVFDMIERDIATTGVRFLPPPVETLSEDGKAFWNARDPEALANRERMERDVYFGDDVAARIGVNAPGVVTTPAFDAKRGEFEAELLRIAKRIKDKGVQVEVQNRIQIGKYELNGYYDSGRKLIKIALESGLDNALTTIRHEEIHALRDLGLITDAEWKLLTEAANKARVRSDIGQDKLVEYRQSYAAKVAKEMLTRRGFVDLVKLPWADVETKLVEMFGFDPVDRVASLQSINLWDEAILQDLLDEEAVAVLVSERMGGQSYGTKVDAIVDRIAQFLERLSNALRGLGFQTVEDVFQAIDEGAIGKRDPALEGMGGTFVPKGLMFAIRAYHGSPHSFRKFRMDRIGTGEGAQAYGYGFYFAESESIAKWYRVHLGLGNNPRNHAAMDQAKEALDFTNGDTQLALKRIDDIFANSPEDRRHAELSKQYVMEPPGHLYEVSIDADEERFLDWDKPLAEQSDFVNKRMQSILGDGWDQGPHEWKGVVTKGQPVGPAFMNGLLAKNPVEAAEKLKAAGVVGVRYLDADSRARGDGNRNLVVFDENLVQIVSVNGQPVEAEEKAEILSAAQEAEQQPGGMFENVMASFAGPSALTANLSALEDAQKMEVNGQPREAIWKSTGWFRGVDGQWRFEIDDSSAALTGRRSGDLVDVIDASGVFEAYPDMQASGARTRLSERTSGYQSSAPGETLFAEGPDAAAIRRILLHEIQHGIQDREDFAAGGNLSTKGPTKRLTGIQARRFVQASELRSAAAHLKMGVDEYVAWRRDWAADQSDPRPFTDIDDRPMDEKSIALAKDDAAFEALRSKQAMGGSGYHIYNRLAGEVEARATAARAGLTADERSARPPWLDYDVAESDQIVLRSNGGAASIGPLPQSYVDSLNRRIEELGRAPTPSIAYDPVNPRHVAARHLAEKGNKDKAMASLQEFVERYKTSMPPISRRYAKARDLLESGADLGVDFSDVFGEAQPSRDAKSGKATTKTNNLDMSQAAKRHRAQSMGFDTSRVFFRGDDNIRDIKAFDLEKVGSARKGLYGNGIYLSALPEVAESYGPVGMFYVRAKKTFVFDDRDPNMIAKIEAIFPSADTTITAGDGLSLRQTAEWTQALKDAGYDSIAVKNRRGEDEEFVVLDTRNIRSVDAAFDPAQSDSANLMFSLAGGRDTGLLPDNILASLAKWGNYQPLGIGTNPQYPNSETEAPEKGLSDVVADTVKALDLEGMARQGRLDPDMKRAARKMGGEMMGQTNRATGVVRLALKNDMATLAHEGGHALEIRASVRDDLSAIKTQFAEDLTVPPAANAPVPMFPQTGFSGIELDQDSIRLAIESVDAERQMRTLAAELAVLKSRPRSRQQEARFQQITPMYEQFQSVAGGNRETLVRRFGADRADAVLLDLMPVDRATAPAYAATRFSKSGQPTPRVVIPPTDVELSEGFAEWFRIYLTNPKQAQALSRGFYDAFEDMLDAAEPEMLTRFQMVQEGVGALAKAAPVSAVRARVQSTVQPGFIEAIRLGLSEAAEAGRIAAETARRTGDGNQVAAMISGFSGEIWRPMGDRLYGFYHAAFDARHPMKKAVQFLIDKAVENSGVKLGKGERAVVKALHDPYKLWRLAEHSKTHATAALQFGIVHKGQIDPSGPSYWDALTEAFGGSRRGQWNDDMAEMFGSYLIGRRMLAEFSRYDRGELENVPDTIISRDVWQKSTAQLEKEYPQFKRAAQTMYRFGQELLRYKFEAGFLTQEQFDEYRNRVDYTPLNRIMDAGTPSMLGGSSNANKRRLIYRFQGSTRDFINPLETIAQDMFATQQRVEMNRVIGAMDRVARAAGPGGGAIAERIPAKQMKATRIRVADVASLAKPLRGALARTGLDKADRDSLLADAQNEMRDTMRLTAMQSGLSMDDQQMLLDTIDLLFDGEASKTIFQSTDISEAGEPIVYLWEGGQRIPIRMGDNEIAKDIFEGFQAFGSNDTNPLVDAAALGTQALRAGITKAPSYVLVNYLRDQLSTWVLSDNFVPFVTGAKGLKSALTSDAVGKRYAAFAGLMGGVDANLIDQAANKHDVLTLRTKGFFAVPAKSGIGQVWQRSLKAMEITEAGTRFGHFEAAFNRAKADGMSEEEAAFEAAYAAHDVIDFSRRGSKTMEVSRIVAFLNAALQGLDSTRRAFTGERDAFTGYRALITPYIKATNGTPLSVAERKGLPMAARTFNKMVVLGMIGLTLSMLYKDDEEYEEFNDYMKATHWFFKIGDTWYRFPKPFDLAIFSQIFEGAFDRVVKQDPRAGEKFMQSLKHTMVPPHEVNVANLYYEMVTGIDTFRNREIVPMDLSKLPPELQFGAYTSEMGRMIGSITGMSPQKVDHLMGGLLGTIGRDIQTVSDAVLPMANEALGGPLPGVSDRPRADKSFEDTVILSRFTRRAGRGSLSSETFWKQMKNEGGEYTSAAEGYKSLRNSGRGAEARDLLANVSDDQRAYAILEVEFAEKEQDINPLNRAKQVMSAMSGIRKEMVLGRLYKGNMTSKEIYKAGDDAEEIVLQPSKQKIVNEILEDLSMREARNALVAVGLPGWAQKDIMPTDGLMKELEAAAPEVAEELALRLTKGRNKVYPFEGVRRAWAGAREELLAKGAEADLSEFVADAKGWEPDDAPVSRPAGMMRLGGPVETNPTMEVSDDLAADLEFSAAGRPFLPEPDEDTEGGWMDGVGQEREAFTPSGP